MRLITALLLMTIAARAPSTEIDDQQNKSIDCTYLNGVPLLLGKFFDQCRPTTSDSIPDIQTKDGKLLAELLIIEKHLIRSYYTNGEIDSTQIDGIRSIGLLRANLHYPIYPTIGASGYGGLIQEEQEKLFLDLILLTCHQIQSTLQDPGLHIIVKPISSVEWDKQWNDTTKIRN
jgi:hypothetical protein